MSQKISQVMQSEDGIYTVDKGKTPVIPIRGSADYAIYAAVAMNFIRSGSTSIQFILQGTSDSDKEVFTKIVGIYHELCTEDEKVSMVTTKGSLVCSIILKTEIKKRLQSKDTK